MTTENTTPVEEQTPAATPPVTEGAPLSLEQTPAATPPATPTVEGTENKGTVEVVTYNPTGDERLDMMLDFVGKLGYKPDAPAMKLAINGDFSMLEAELAGKDVKGYQAYIALGKTTFNDMKAKNEAKATADREAVENAVGGAEEWKSIQAWASANADEGERKEISKLLSGGGFQARMTAEWLKGLYDRANNRNDEGEGKPVSTAKASAPNSGALSPREYAQEVAKARIGFKGDFDNSSVYRALQARRAAYRG